MSLKPKDDDHHGNKVVVILPGIVDEIIPAFTPVIGHSQPEKAQIAVDAPKHFTVRFGSTTRCTMKQAMP
jgi:hypothetical protein